MSSDARWSWGLLAWLAGCDACPPDEHVLRAMRVLGTTFDPPIATPGAAVTARVVTADVEARDLDVVWYRCPEPLVLTPVVPGPGGSPDAGADLYANAVGRCLATGAFARGVSVRVPVDREGGQFDAVPWRPARRWTDLLGFACAGGEAQDPPKGGLWPRCTGTRGVLFTASIPGPQSDGANPPPLPATITDLVYRDGATTRTWDEGVIPEVARCEDEAPRCAGVEIRFRVENATEAVETAGTGLGVLGSPDDRVAFVGYHVTGRAPSSNDVCVTSDPDARINSLKGSSVHLRWAPPAETGDVTFWFTARRLSGGLSVVRRTVRVR